VDRPEPNQPDSREEKAEAEAGRAADSQAEEGRDAPGPSATGETDATFAEQLGDPNDLAEFDDLLESLRDAMQAAEEAREEMGEATRKAEAPEAETARAESVAAEPEATVESEAAPAADWGDYPEWLCNGVEGESEAAPESEIDETVVERFGRLPRRHVYRSFESSRISAHAMRCRVKLSSNGREFVGEAEGPSVPGVRAEIAARATLNALSVAEREKLVLSLMAARVLRFSDMPLVVVSVYGMSDEEVNRLVGVSVVDASEEQAAILATLQATDRWIAGVVGRAKS